jgi:YesN/AraC family two-component response regulator
VLAQIVLNGKSFARISIEPTINVLPDEKSWQEIYERCKNFKVDFVELKKVYFEVKYFEVRKLERATKLIDMLAKYICHSDFAQLRESRLIENIKNFANNNFNMPITIKDLSIHLNMSKGYLVQVIKRELKTTFTDYLNEMRVKKAKELLERTNKPISEVTFLVGLTDQGYFSKMFKKFTGLTPSKYKNNIQSVRK